MPETGRGCPAFPHDSSFVVRIAFGNALWFSGGYFGCRNALEFRIDMAARKAERKSGTLQRECERVRHMNAICPEAMGSGSLFFLRQPGSGEGEGETYMEQHGHAWWLMEE